MCCYASNIRCLYGIIFSSIILIYFVEIAPEGTSVFFYGSLNQIDIILVWFSLISLDYLRVIYGIKLCRLLAGLIWLIVKQPVVELLNEEQETKEILMVK